jgi:hypothetical protein
MSFFGLINSRRRPTYRQPPYMAYPNVYAMSRTIRDLQLQVSDLQLQSLTREVFVERAINHIEKVESTNVLDLVQGSPNLLPSSSDFSLRIGHVPSDFTEIQNSKNLTIGALANGAISGGFTASRNVVIGHIANGNATTGSKNCVMGHNAAFENMTGSNNTVLGYGAHWDNKDGNYNTAVGESAGNNTVGSYNTFIGEKAGRIAGLTAEAYLNYNYTSCLGVGSFATGDNQIVLGRPLVDIVRGGNYYNCADERDISKDDSEMLGLDFIHKLKPLAYTNKNKNNDDSLHYGLLAKDIDEVLGSRDTAMVNTSNDQQLLCYTELIAPMIKSIQELNAKIAQLESRLIALEPEPETEPDVDTSNGSAQLNGTSVLDQLNGSSVLDQLNNSSSVLDQLR